MANYSHAGRLAGCLVGNLISLITLQDLNNIVGIIFAVVGCLITIISGVIIPIIKYIKGKITEDELKDELDKFNKDKEDHH